MKFVAALLVSMLLSGCAAIPYQHVGARYARGMY